MTPARRRRTRRKTHSPLPLILIIIAAIVAFSVYKCQTTFSAPNTSPIPTDSLADSLYLNVIIPPNTDSRLISYPGFNVSFNRTHHQPNYSAWILTRQHADGPNSRSNKFATDFSIDGCATLDDYRNSGYDRGHMAPAGDMKWSSDAMQSSFLLTNISPQAKRLNQGAWKKLEEKTRQWAQRDSVLIIVCGPILTDRITKTIGDSHVSVPARYFKAILAPYTDPPRAIAFIMNNGYIVGGIQAAAVSVDQAEAITGFDFFSALPDSIENKIESQYSFSQWTLTR